MTLVDQGNAQSVSGTATDKAGNSKAATAAGIDIDLTKPTLDAQPRTAPNGAGWYRGDVTIDWIAADDLSGVDAATAPAPSVVTGEGANLGAGPKSVTDKAGNVSDPASISGLRIDRTAPSTTANLPAPLASGWYANGPDVTLPATDRPASPASTRPPTASTVVPRRCTAGRSRSLSAASTR